MNVPRFFRAMMTPIPNNARRASSPLPPNTSMAMIHSLMPPLCDQAQQTAFASIVAVGGAGDDGDGAGNPLISDRPVAGIALGVILVSGGALEANASKRPGAVCDPSH